MIKQKEKPVIIRISGKARKEIKLKATMSNMSMIDYVDELAKRKMLVEFIHN